VIQDIQGDGDTTYQINYDTISKDSDIATAIQNIKAKVRSNGNKTSKAVMMQNVHVSDLFEQELCQMLYSKS
jgi:hypothetical protein